MATLTNAMSTVKAALEAAVAKIEPVLRPILIKAYRGHADYRFAEVFAQAGDPEVGPQPTHKEEFGAYRHWTSDWHRWMALDAQVVERLWKKKKIASTYDFHRPTWELIYKYPEAFKVKYSYADAAANHAFENARESFVQKNFGKFDFVMGHRDDLSSIDINIGYQSGVFEGGVRVTLSDASFLCSIGLKYVLRTIPNVTPYYQYPLLFVEVTVGGKKHRAPSEVEVRDLLGGGAPKTEAQIQEEKGLCPGSGKEAPGGWQGPRYMKCPICGEHVSVAESNYGRKLRAHKTKTAQRSEMLAKGFCEMSEQPIPKEVSDAAIALAVKKDKFYGGRFILEKPFDSYEVRFPCTVCGAKAGSASSRQGIYKKHKTK
jgi:hypothetical protein